MAFRFGIVLPETPDIVSDWREVDHGKLTVTIAGGAPIVIRTAKAIQETKTRIAEDPLLVGPQDAACHAEFVHVDDAGNESRVPTTLDFVLFDDVPPVDPKAIGVAILEELPDA